MTPSHQASLAVTLSLPRRFPRTPESRRSRQNGLPGYTVFVVIVSPSIHAACAPPGETPALPLLPYSPSTKDS